MLNIPWYYNIALTSLHLSHVTREAPLSHDANTLFFMFFPFLLILFEMEEGYDMHV